MQCLLGSVVEEENGFEKRRKERKKERKMMLPHVVSMTLLDITNLRLRDRGEVGRRS